MTTEEAVNHLFHSKVVKHLKKEKDKVEAKPKKRRLKKG